MERSVVSFVVKRLGDYTIEEYKLVKNVRKQIERLKKELISINDFLQNAHGMRFEDLSMRRWVSDARDIAYDVDDLLDAFFLKVESRKALIKPFLFFKKNGIGKEIVTVFSILQDITSRKHNYGGLLQSAEKERLGNEASLRRVYAHKEDVDIVGLEEDINRVEKELLTKYVSLQVVSICGMGGLGKSTLAKSVYSRVKSRFDCCAWYFLSQRCKTDEVLRDILRQVLPTTSPQWENMSEPQLVEELFTVLKQKRYLVVLDDIWSSDVWNMLNPAFPDGTGGSKVIFTTRNKKIAAEADSRCAPFVPRFLSDKDAWDLLCKKAFPRYDTGSSWSPTDDLKCCGKAMVKKCGGLPLAITALGKILATKNTLHEWEAVSNHISLHIYGSEGEGDVFTSLGLSYVDLPFHLKPLFLYMGLFPEHQNIHVNVLIKMWYGEYLAYHDDEYQVVKGRIYIQELVDRSMVLEFSRNSQGTTAKTCGLHHVMRDFCIFKASEENFLRILGKSAFTFNSSSSSHLSSPKLRRCAIYVNNQSYLFPKQLKPCLRTGIFFVGLSPDLAVKRKDFKLVKVLEFNQVIFQDKNLEKGFLDVLASLVNLRYLGLNRTNIQELPASIGNLVHLETLDARSTCQGFIFPDVIRKLTSLKHFYITNHDLLTGLHRLVKLRILSSIKGDLWTDKMIELIHLEKLGIVDLKPETLKSLISSVMNEFANLRSLALSMSNDLPFPSNVESLSHKRDLRKLSLKGKMASFPSTWPTNLIKLRLLHSRVNKDPMQILKNLRHLTHLSLNQAFVGEEMVCSHEGFPQLQYLEIEDLPGLVIWTVELGAVPNLQTCIINRCSLLGAIPHGFGFNLENLVIRDMPPRFCARIRRGGEDWHSISNISSVKIEKTNYCSVSASVS